MVYDEDENNLTLDDIKEDTQIIPLIQLSGLKFTSHSFSLEFNLKQIMVLKNLSSKPLITITNSEKTIDSNKTSDVKVNKNNLSKSMDENKKEVLQTSDSLKDIVEDITTHIKVENLDIIKENKKTSEAGKEDEAGKADQ